MPPAQTPSPSKPLILTVLIFLLAVSNVLAAEPLQPDAQGFAAGTLSVSPTTMTVDPAPVLSGSIGLSQAQETEKVNAGVRARGRDPGYGHAGLGIVACVVAFV